MVKLEEILFFYLQLLNGCSEADLNKLRLVRDPAAYYYVGQGDSNKTSAGDRSDYKAVTSAMTTLGFAPSETQTIWSILAGILNLVINCVD